MFVLKGSTIRLRYEFAASPHSQQLHVCVYHDCTMRLQYTGLTLTPPSGGGSGLTPIYTIQGSGTASPLAGTVVRTRGVVTLRLPSYDVPG
jgi:hypothetical protein